MTMRSEYGYAKPRAVSTKWQTALTSRTKRVRTNPFHITTAEAKEFRAAADDFFARRANRTKNT